MPRVVLMIMFSFRRGGLVAVGCIEDGMFFHEFASGLMVEVVIISWGQDRGG